MYTIHHRLFADPILPSSYAEYIDNHNDEDEDEDEEEDEDEDEDGIMNTVCPYGTYSNGGGVCLPCAAGRWSYSFFQNNETCDDECGVGFYCPPGLFVCVGWGRGGGG